MVDSEHVVHTTSCPEPAGRTVPYTARPESMHAWLSRPDLCDSHAGPAVITGCPLCVVADDPDL